MVDNAVFCAYEETIMKKIVVFIFRFVCHFSVYLAFVLEVCDMLV